MDSPFLGMIVWFGFNFPPRGWAQCNGQLLPISQNTALFSLLGTYYGGNGTSNFALPDLRGRLPLHQGQGPGLSNYSIGEVIGSENHTLTLGEMPQHSHNVMVIKAESTAANGAIYGSQLHTFGPSLTDKMYSDVIPALHPMHSSTVSNAGSGLPYSLLNPSLTLNACIALQGIFPSRN